MKKEPPLMRDTGRAAGAGSPWRESRDKAAVPGTALPEARRRAGAPDLNPRGVKLLHFGLRYRADAGRTARRWLVIQAGVRVPRCSLLSS